MTNEEITQTARRLRGIHETSDPRALCSRLDINIDYLPMGSGKDALKGLITRSSRCSTISINSDQPVQTQDIVTFHEIGHCVLRHHERKQVCAFQDYGLFDKVSELEDEANRFVAEYLLEDQRTLEILKENGDFFRSASILRVPGEILDYKMRMLRYYELLGEAAPIYARRDFMGRIQYDGLENGDYA